MLGKRKSIVRVADTATAVEALGENTDAIAVEIVMTKIADTADTTMIENAAIVTDPALDPAAETTADVARTHAPQVAPAARTKITRDVDVSSGVTRQRLVGGILNVGGIVTIVIVGIKSVGYQLHIFSWAL